MQLANRVVWAKCSKGEHDESSYGSCQFVGDFVDNAGNPGFPPYPYIISTYSCIEAVDETLIPINHGGNGDEGSGGGSPGNPIVNNCSEVASNPYQVGINDENGCNIGVITQPNLRPSQNPCETIKKSNTDSKYKSHSHVITLREKGHLNNEVGYKLSNPIPNTGQNGT
ncbi:hypothetical protein [Chryseobacterium sp.]|uniref:hypothetical protein n=1 Tax=Chryseobacterium sp. TaxID=1871047 RepID=UPI002898C8C3|nr:hypothetical protein [Chryseobacterium sp.]